MGRIDLGLPDAFLRGEMKKIDPQEEAI